MNCPTCGKPMQQGPLNWFCVEPQCGTRVYEKENVISRHDPKTGKLTMKKLRSDEGDEYNWNE